TVLDGHRDNVVLAVVPREVHRAAHGDAVQRDRDRAGLDRRTRRDVRVGERPPGQGHRLAVAEASRDVQCPPRESDGGGGGEVADDRRRSGGDGEGIGEREVAREGGYSRRERIKRQGRRGRPRDGGPPGQGRGGIGQGGETSVVAVVERECR